MTSDLELARAVAQGDAQAWNTFIQRYGDMVLSAVMVWTDDGSRVPPSQYDTILRAIRQGKPEPAEERDTCREGVALYRFALDALKSRLGAYEGKCSLGAFLRLALRDVRREYMTTHMGRLTVPPPVAALPERAQAVYRLGTRLNSRAAIAQRLHLTEAEVQATERQIQQALKADGKEWWVLASWEGDPALAHCGRAEELAAMAERRLPPQEAEALTAHVATCPACTENMAFLEEAAGQGGIAPPVAAPAWLNHQVMDRTQSDAPIPAAASDSWQRKVLAQPDWLVGIGLGAIATTLVLLVLIPRLEYGKVVREPGDQLLARAASPLEPSVGTKLAEARKLLAKNKIDPAMQNLKAVLAARPDNLEARWLLATTYDRMGDQAQAAQQYHLFLDTEARERAVIDDRVRRAKARLESWEDMP